MHLSLFDYALWFLTPLLQVGVLLAMWKRNLHSLYPRFFGYTILQVVSVPILAFLMTRSFTDYYYSYYVNLGLGVILSFAVVYEASRLVFDQDDKSLRALQVLWTAVMLIGFLLLGTTTPPTHSVNGAITDSLMLADRVVRVFQLVLLIGFTFFSASLRISSRSFVYGVALGFGFFAVVSMLILVVVKHHAAVNTTILSRVNAISYLVATLVWLAYSIYGSPGPTGLEFSHLDLPTDREFRKWKERNFKDPFMSVIRVRKLIR